MNEKGEWLQKLQEEVEIPEIMLQKAEQSFQKIREEKMYKEPAVRLRKKKCSHRKKVTVVILAATLMISTLTAGAASYFHWNNHFFERYNVSAKIENKLNDNQVAKELHQYTEHDGIRIEAVQSIADDYTAHIVLRIYGKEGFVFDDKMNFGSIDVKVNGNDGVGWSGVFLDDYTEKDRSNGADYEILINDQFEQGLLNREVKLTFDNVINEYEGKLNKTESPVLIDSTWELNLTLDNVENGKVYEVNQQIPGSEAVVKSIQISSVSYVMEMEWKPKTVIETYVDENGVEGTFEHRVGPPGLYGVAYEDGSSREGVSVMNHGLFTNNEETEYRLMGYQIELIDPENVSELIFNLNGEIVRVPVVK